MTNDGVPLSENMVKNFLQQVSELKRDIQNGANLLIAGVDDDHGAQILELRDGSLTRHRSLGYQCIGSGAGSASLTFMRNGYNPDDLEDALFLAADAKNQAGEAQGVGDKMDIAVVTDDVTLLDEDRTKHIQGIIEDARDAEREARKKTINDANVGSIR